MKTLYRLLFGRVTVRPACFADHRQQWQIDRDWQLRFDARVRRNLMERDAIATRLAPDPNFVPTWMLAPLPAILQQQAA